MVYAKTLLAWAEDIEDRSLWDWLKAHTLFMKPLHRYRGTLTVGPEQSSFVGRDEKQGEGFSLTVPRCAITDLHLGFDVVFRRSEDRQLGLLAFKPLRIKYRDKEGEQTSYLFASFHHSGLGWRASKNAELFQELKTGGAQGTHA